GGVAPLAHPRLGVGPPGRWARATRRLTKPGLIAPAFVVLGLLPFWEGLETEGSADALGG
ncbi:MAG: hypothetical protein AAF690_23790, partial [Acidobacteriota bacterium]